MTTLRTLIASTALATTVLAFAQPATPAEMGSFAGRTDLGIVRFQTRLGSFRIINGEGRLEFAFTGTLMLSRVEGDYQVSGRLRKEWDKNDRVIYTGTGRVVVTGKWRAVQWFGRDLRGQMFGGGTMRLAGEFDRDQRTGEYWFEDPTIKQFWPAGTTFDILVPNRTAGMNPNVRPRQRR